MKTTHINTGLRSYLENPKFYNLFQSIIGANDHRRKHFEKLFPLSSGMSVLDIGCGTGIFADYINKFIEYHGCDMEEKYIDYCLNKFKSSNFSFYQEKVGENDRKDWHSKFDYINAHGLLHHLPDSACKILLQTSKRYLKSGGKLITVDSTFHSKQSKLRKWLVSKDRGQNIKTPYGYKSFASAVFENVDGYIDDSYSRIIPFSVYIMTLTK